MTTYSTTGSMAMRMLTTTELLQEYLHRKGVGGTAVGYKIEGDTLIIERHINGHAALGSFPLMDYLTTIMQFLILINK